MRLPAPPEDEVFSTHGLWGRTRDSTHGDRGVLLTIPTLWMGRPRLGEPRQRYHRTIRVLRLQGS